MIRKIKITDNKDIQILCDVALGYKVTVALVRNQIQKLQHDPHHVILVYEDESTHQVVGFIHGEVYESLYSEKGLNLLGLAVLPRHQSLGIGKRLLEQIEAIAKAQQFSFIRLNSAEYRKNAHQFYERQGYVSDKIQKRFIKKL